MRRGEEGAAGKAELPSYLIDTIKIVNSKSAIVSERAAYTFITMSVTAICTDTGIRGGSLVRVI